MSRAGTWNIVIEQGATFDRTLTWKDNTGANMNLTGYSARMMLRSTYTSPTPIVSLVSPANITLGGTAGTIRIVITDTVTAGLAAPSNGVYDLELVSGTLAVTRLVEGTYTVVPEVTH